MPILSLKGELSEFLREDSGFPIITNWLPTEFDQAIGPSNLCNQAISSDAPDAVTGFGWASDNFCHFSPGSRWRSLQPRRSTTNESLNVAPLK